MTASHRPAIVLDDERVDEATFKRQVDALTLALARSRVGPGSLLQVESGDALQFAVTAAAALRLGAILVTGDAGAVMRDGYRFTYLRADGSLTTLPPGDTEQPAPRAPQGGFVFATSGSTGEPKAVLIETAALDYQVSATWDRLEGTADDHWVLPLPLTHAYGFSVLAMWLRHKFVLELTTPQSLPRRISSGAATVMDGAPRMYQTLVHRSRTESQLATALRSLRVRGCGGDVLGAELQRCCIAQDMPLHDGYGLTEAGPNVAVAGPSLWREGTVGKPLAGTSVRLSAEDEIQVRGPGLMTEYIGDPESTTTAITESGWLRTGDIGKIDAQGFLMVTGRRKFVIIVNGETFAPASIEEALAGSPGILEVAVAAGPSIGHRRNPVVAFVAVDPHLKGDAEQQLKARARARLPVAVRPSAYYFVDSLPRLASGKVDRWQLAQAIGQEAQ